MLKRYATQAGGEIAKLFRIAETASKGDERKTSRELVAYAKKNAAFLDGLLFYKVDRAARKLFDYVELERLELEYDLPFISVSQPTENTSAGRMMRRTLANKLLPNSNRWMQQQDSLLNLRLSEDVDQETFARKDTELQLDALDRSHDETAELASKVFELSQTLRQQWLTAEYDAKRRILEIVFLNCRLDGATLVPTIRKPFDVLAEGLLVQSS